MFFAILEYVGGSNFRFLALFALVSAAAACGKVDAKSNSGPTATKVLPTKVVVERVHAPPLVSTVRLYGEVRTARRSTVGAEVAGKVQKVHRREGESVQVGDLIVSLDARIARQRLSELRAQLRALDAERDVAAQQLSRFLAVGEEAASASERDEARARSGQAEANLEALKAQVAAAEATLSQHQVRAPFGGELTQLDVDRGSFVGVGGPVGTLISGGPPEVWAFGTPAVLSQLKPGQKLKGIYKKDNIGLYIIEIVDGLSEQGSTQVLRLAMETEIPVTLGDSLAVFAERRVEGEGIVVPRDALLQTPVGDWFLFVVEDSKAKRVAVDVNYQDASLALVQARDVKLLEPRSQVIVRGNERVLPDAKVKVTPMLMKSDAEAEVIGNSAK